MMVPLPKSVSLSNSILMIWLKLHSSHWLKKMNTFQYTTTTCTVYNSDWGSTFNGYIANIFPEKKTYFLHHKKLFTQTFGGKVTFLWTKFVKIYFDRVRFFIFNIIRLILFQFFWINFLTIVNAIYILYEAKIGVKLGCFFCNWGVIGLCWDSFLHNFIEPQVISKTMFLNQHCNE